MEVRGLLGNLQIYRKSLTVSISDHNILLSKLENLSIARVSLNYLKSYFNNRKIYIEITQTTET